MKKRFPPFGKQLKAKMQSGWQPKNGVNIYTSWTMGHNHNHGITFPPDSDPNEFDWSFLADQEVSLINTEGFAEYEKLKQLAVILVQSGVKCVALIDVNHPLQWYVPETKREVAA